MTTVSDRGELLSKRIEDAYEVDTKGRIPFPWQYVVLFIMAVMLIVLPFVVPFGWEFIDLFFIFVYSVIGMMFLMAIIALLPIPKKAVRVYENGAEVESWRGDVKFIPWGLFRSGVVIEKAGRKTLRMRGVLGWATISDTMPHFDDFQEEIAERIGKKEYRFVEPEGAQERHALTRRYIMIWLLASAIASGIAIAISYTVFFEFHESVLMVMVVLGFIWIALNLIPAMAKWFLDPLRAFYLGLDRRKVAAAFTALFIVLYPVFLWGYIGALPDIMRHGHDIHSTLDPGDSTIEPGNYTDQVLKATGPVTVRDGESLRLVNCTLEFDPAPGHRWGLWVGEGGALHLEDTLLRSVDNDVGYNVEIHGQARILDSIIDGLSTAETVWSEADQRWRMDYGLEVYSDDVLIDGSRIVEPIETGMVTYRCSPTLNNVTFVKSGRTSLIIFHGSPTVTNCIFDGGYRGVLAVNATLDIRNCTFIGNGYGAEVEWCTGRMNGNLFEANRWGALTTIGSDLELEDNLYSGNGDDATHWSVIDPIYGMIATVWLIIPGMILSVCIKDLYRGLRNYEEDED